MDLRQAWYQRWAVIVWGGPGSGHHGHAGRPGERGGSSPRGGALASKLPHEPKEWRREKALERAGWDIPREAEKLGVTEEEYVAKVEARLEKDLAQPVAIRTSAKSAMGVAKDGRFKTQHEIGDPSRYTHYDPRMRVLAERNGLGVPEESPVEDRPVYGYFQTEGHAADQFGAIEFVLKDSVKERTTYTLGDALGAFRHEMLVGGTSPSDQGGWGSRSGDYLAGRVDYVEGQIQGGVSLGDVAKVVIHQGAGDIAVLRSALEAKGIEVEVDESTR